jgi:predicted dehydrogenase
LAAGTAQAALAAEAKTPQPEATPPAPDAKDLPRVVVGVMGMGGRGTELACLFSQQPGVELAYVCCADANRMAAAAASVEKACGKKPKTVGDFRRILDDKAVDALVIAAPNHWHAPATILACAAGKHVYVEKPCCHNPHEGELQVAAARKHNRVVQHGTQRRSWPGIGQAIGKLREGAIGAVRVSRGWYNNLRPTIGRGKPAAVPDWLDYELWQGPAPRRPFRDNLVHYNWHWFWHWGNGEIGNNGVHSIDICRWGLGVEFPRKVSSGGGRLWFDDDQETPDTQSVTFDFGDKLLIWEGRSCHSRGFEGNRFGIAFYGDRGTLVIDGGGYTIYDLKDKEIEKQTGRAGDADHVPNFLECVRNGRRPNADIEIGYRSVLLCHLGAIAHRTGRTLRCDPQNGRILDDAEAAALWRREYAPGWEPGV